MNCISLISLWSANWEYREWHAYCNTIINHLLYINRTRDQGLFDLLLQKSPFWLEIIAQHAMDYSDVPVILVGQESDDGRVTVVGWGNCGGDSGSIQQVKCIKASAQIEQCVRGI